MDERDKPIEGFTRRPRRVPPIDPSEIFVVHDSDSENESSVPQHCRQENLQPVVKCETGSGSTASEITINDDEIDSSSDGKKKRKKNKRKKVGKGSRRKFKKELRSDESSSSDDSNKRRVKHK